VNPISYRTQFVSKKAHVKSWYVLNAEGQTLGRLATKVASVLRGKHKPSYTPHDDAGDYVIILNSNKVRLTGNKWNDKEYIRHTGFPGGQRMAKAKDLNAKNPKALVENAIRGMLPKNSLGREQFRKLFVYAEAEHKHAAQNPIEIKLN